MNRFFIAIAALKALCRRRARAARASCARRIEKYGIDPEKPDPARS